MGSSITDASIVGVVGNRLSRNGALALRAAGTRAVRTSVSGTSGVSSVMTRDSTGNAHFSDVPLAGILIESGDVEVLDCDVTDNGSDGIRIVTGSNVVIRDCNLERNVGFGVINQGSAPVNARRNWWGDPAGPHGLSGDGVSGNVDPAEPRSTRR